MSDLGTGDIIIIIMMGIFGVDLKVELLRWNCYYEERGCHSLEESFNVLTDILVVQFAVQTMMEFGHDFILVRSVVLFNLLWAGEMGFN